MEIFGHKLGREYIRTAQTLPIYETVALYTGLVCIIHGKGDEVVPYSYAERFHKACKKVNCIWLTAKITDSRNR